MFERLLDLLGNSHFEAYIGGPIAGFIVGLLFAAFGNRPSTGTTTQTPGDTYTYVIQHYYQAPASKGRNNNNSQNNDDGGAAFGIGLLGLALGFLFVAYLPQISFGLCFLIASVSAFTMASCMLGLLSGQFNTPAWWQHTIFPLAISLLCWYIVTLAEQAIDIRVVDFARNLLGSGQLTVARVFNSAFVFYKNINNDYVKWIFHQMGAFTFALFAALGVLMQWLHYVALANSRNGGTRAWASLAIRTARFNSFGVTLTATIFSLLGWLLASGEMYGLLHAETSD